MTSVLTPAQGPGATYLGTIDIDDVLLNLYYSQHATLHEILIAAARERMKSLGLYLRRCALGSIDRIFNDSDNATMRFLVSFADGDHSVDATLDLPEEAFKRYVHARERFKHDAREVLRCIVEDGETPSIDLDDHTCDLVITDRHGSPVWRVDGVVSSITEASRAIRSHPRPNCDRHGHSRPKSDAVSIKRELLWRDVQVPWRLVIQHSENKPTHEAMFAAATSHLVAKIAELHPKFTHEAVQAGTDLIIRDGSAFHVALRDVDGDVWRFHTEDVASPLEGPTVSGLDESKLAADVATTRTGDLGEVILRQCARSLTLSFNGDELAPSGVVVPVGDEDFDVFLECVLGVRKVRFHLPEDDLLRWYELFDARSEQESQ